MKIEQVKAEETYQIRRDMFRPGMDISNIIYKEDNDPDTFHLAIREDGKVVSCATFIKQKNPDFTQENQWRMRGVCTYEGYRKRGYATALIKKGFEMIQERGATMVWFNARHYVIDFYRSFGCIDYGEFFLIPNSVMHKKMYKIF